MVSKIDKNAMRLKRACPRSWQNLRHSRASPSERVPFQREHLRPDHRRRERRYSGFRQYAGEGISRVSPATSEGAKKVGAVLAERAKAKGISEVVFDRGGYIYPWPCRCSG